MVLFTIVRCRKLDSKICQGCFSQIYVDIYLKYSVHVLTRFVKHCCSSEQWGLLFFKYHVRLHKNFQGGMSEGYFSFPGGPEAYIICVLNFIM